MADSNLKQTFTTDDTKILASYAKLLRQQQAILAQTIALANSSKKQSDDARAALDRQNDMLGKSISAVKGLATSYLSVQGAVRLVNSEIERKIQLDSKAKEAQLTVADARAAFLRNAVALSAADRERAVAQVEAIASKTGVDQRKLFTSAGSALSAAGDKDLDQVLSAVETAARYVPGSSGEPEAVAGGLLDISSLTKTADAIANLGTLAATQAKARVTTTEAVSRSLVPAAINVASYGDKPAEALSLVAAMTNAIKDYTGRMSGNATIRMAQQLNEFFKPAEIRREVTDALTEKPGALGTAQTNPAIAQALEQFLGGEGLLEKNRIKPGDTVGQVELLKHDEGLAERFIQAQIAYRTAGGQVGTTSQRIEFLQTHPDLAKAFFNREEFGASFEAKPAKQIEELLTNVNSEISRNFKGFQATIPRGEEARAVGEKALADVEGDRMVRQAQLARRLESATDRLLTGNLQAGEAGITREGLKKILEATGVGATEDKLKRLEYEINTGFGTSDAFDELQRQLEQRSHELRYRPATPLDETPEGGFVIRMPKGDWQQYRREGELTGAERFGKIPLIPIEDPEKLRQAALLDDLLGTLRAARQEASQAPLAPVDESRGRPAAEPDASRMRPPAAADVGPTEAMRPPVPAQPRPGSLPAMRAQAPAGADSPSPAESLSAGAPLRRESPEFDGALASTLRTVALENWGGSEADKMRFGDELALLDREQAPAPAELAGHSEDLSALYDRAALAKRHFDSPGSFDLRGGERRLPDDRPQNEYESQMAGKLDAMLVELKKLHEQAVKAEQAQSTANRQNGARASRARGKE